MRRVGWWIRSGWRLLRIRWVSLTFDEVGRIEVRRVFFFLLDVSLRSSFSWISSCSSSR